MSLEFILWWTDWEIAERMSRPSERERRMLIEDFGSKHVIFVILITQRPGPNESARICNSQWLTWGGKREGRSCSNVTLSCECVEDSQTNVSHHSPPGYTWPTAQSPPLYSHDNSPLIPPAPLFLRASAKSDKPQMGVVVCRHTCSRLLPEQAFEMTTIYIRWRADKKWERKYKCSQFWVCIKGEEEEG